MTTKETKQTIQSYVSETLRLRGNLYVHLSKPFFLLSGTRYAEQTPTIQKQFIAETQKYRFVVQPGKDYHQKYLDSFEPHVQTWVPRAKENEYFFDVGAHVGRHSVDAARKGYTVFAFEPHPETHRVLTKNIQLNTENHQKIRTPRAAITNTRKKVGVSDKQHSGSNHVKENGDITGLPLDHYRNYASRTRYIKVDVEGHENHVLRGAQRFLRSCRVGTLLQLETQQIKPNPKLLKGWRVVYKAGRDTLYKKHREVQP
jgi:FkbM family methyltransferase